MARAIWTGSVSFGLVNVPVGLFSATQDHEVHFHQFEKGTSNRVRNQRVNEQTGDEVAYKDIVKGAEVGDGDYVMLTQEELESVEPGRSRTIDISDFVDASEIDPIYYQKSYYLAPSDDTAKKPYALLVRAMEKAERIGVATFVMRGKQYLAAIRPHDGVLVLETMHFADEVRDPGKEVDNLPTRTKVSKKDLDMAVSLITSLTAKWNPENYEDTYTERVKKLVDAKRKNREIVREETAEETSEKVVDLLAALQASVEQAKGHKPGNARRVDKLRTRKAGDEKGKRPSKKELYERASELDVPGRSGMSTDELAEAVAKAEKSQKPKGKGDSRRRKAS
jgi:DNA end-binding protein Ku